MTFGYPKSHFSDISIHIANNQYDGGHNIGQYQYTSRKISYCPICGSSVSVTTLTSDRSMLTLIDRQDRCDGGTTQALGLLAFGSEKSSRFRRNFDRKQTPSEEKRISENRWGGRRKTRQGQEVLKNFKKLAKALQERRLESRAKSRRKPYSYI